MKVLGNSNLFYTMLEKYRNLILWILMIGLSVGLHWKIFNTELIGIHVWRQSQTQINIQNFYRHDFNILNPRNNVFTHSDDNVIRYEFPMMQWGIAASYHVFGENIRTTRVAMFLIGLFGVLGFYKLVEAIFKRWWVAALAAWGMNFAPLFYYYTMNPLPDLLALSTTMWGLWAFVRYTQTRKYGNLCWSAGFLALATLAKLPYIIFGAALGTYALLFPFRYGIRPAVSEFFRFLIIPAMLLPAFFWYRWAIPTWVGNGVTSGILDNKISWERFWDILYFHIYELLPYRLLGTPNLILFGLGFLEIVRGGWYKKATFWALFASGLSVWAYFFFEINMIDKIHDYYMLPFYPPFMILAATGIFGLSQLHFHIRERKVEIGIFVAVTLMLWQPYYAFKKVHYYWSLQESYCNPDIFIHHEALRKAVPNTARCVILNDNSQHVYSHQFDKQGFIYKNNELSAEQLRTCIEKRGATYMYSDSREVDERADIQPFIDTLILQAGSIKVLKLKLPS
jgi:Dolichyl-phosphate-mannose-protein mannosyltransferase